MRLNPHQISSIQKSFAAHFDKTDHIWLFGSRTDPLQKGGDIDLYIETHINDATIVHQSKINFLVTLKMAIGDQKIDVIIKRPDSEELPIYNEAKSTGILIA